MNISPKFFAQTLTPDSACDTSARAVTNHKKRFISYFSVCLLALSSSACAPTAAKKAIAPAHGKYLFSGSIPQEGPPVRVALGSEPVKLVFPGTVRSATGPRGRKVLGKTEGNALFLWTKGSLPTGGESLLVLLADGRQYRLQIVEDSERFLRLVRVGLPLSGQATLETPPQPLLPVEPESYDSIDIQRMIAALEKGGTPSGYHAVDSLNSRPLVDDGSMRASIEKALVAKNLMGFKVRIENLTDQELQISKSSLGVGDIVGLKMNRNTLGPRPPRFTSHTLSEHERYTAEGIVVRELSRERARLK
jgi:hypothetical protein